MLGARTGTPGTCFHGDGQGLQDLFLQVLDGLHVGCTGIVLGG